ncbi:hypothetical protein [Planomonospora venezuelensis]|uniref:Chromosome segregation ATPase n=1 Tax=Planomonospora venezuelensis TaxID=1999 RepID=A0A841DBU9_PLAVE|nr:hypothetical protein [Planomonospora venezuelensis]MBB5967601.1 chromosome segregation ATPase [Planomonospora venezuelensis]GIN00253.1 hypothetical protein Pve01_19110 [Planomonospora venezuelensis]
MLTLEERVSSLEEGLVELNARCARRGVDRTIEAVSPAYERIEEIHKRLVRVETTARETRNEVGFLRDHMVAFTGRLDRMEVRIDELDERLSGRIDELSGRVNELDNRLSGRIDGLSTRVDGLSARIDEMSTRLDALAESNTAMFQAILERLPEKAAS